MIIYTTHEPAHERARQTTQHPPSRPVIQSSVHPASQPNQDLLCRPQAANKY
ncbi:hypothetical protein [Ostreibacterium oceani]|uniref:hypothetical protein n=1 Tax=Ostreibacterium oceani TaxID=2654998 RepID=UPI001C407740|nr:hypothetical protein [Ostreibacterium oceani]